MEDYFFMVILAESDAKFYKRSLDIMGSLGLVKEIMPHVFTLMVRSDIKQKHDELRNEISLNGKSYVMVIALDKNFRSSWFMPSKSSEYLSGIFTKIYERDEEKGESK